LATQQLIGGASRERVWRGLRLGLAATARLSKLMIDANHAYNIGAAHRILRAVEKAGIHWFEEPISPEDIDGYGELKNLTSIYLAAGENEFTKIGFRAWTSRRAVDILQPDLCSAGGFTECRKISAVAQAWHMALIPGVGLGHRARGVIAVPGDDPPAPLALKPIEPLLEFDQSSHPFRQDLIYAAIKVEDGLVRVPDGPGIGVEVNREVVERYEQWRRTTAPVGMRMAEWSAGQAPLRSPNASLRSLQSSLQWPGDCRGIQFARQTGEAPGPR
jgi:L-alanine-DL-glutamate epimerase-like enolase superfamily enzyme